MPARDRELRRYVACPSDNPEPGDPRLRLMRDATREEPGNVFMELVVGEEPDTWLMLEKFTSREAWEEHMTLPHVTEGNAYLADKLREPTELRFYVEK